MQAADFAGKQYYHQDPKLLRFVLSKPPDRVKYTQPAAWSARISRRSRRSARGGHPRRDRPFRRLRRPFLRPGRDDHPSLTTGRARRDADDRRRAGRTPARSIVAAAGCARAPLRGGGRRSCWRWELAVQVDAATTCSPAPGGRPRDRRTGPQGAAAEVHRRLAVPRDLGVLAGGRWSACRSACSWAGSGRPTRRSTR